MSRAVRPIRVEGDLAYVQLNNGCETVIDASDVPVVQGYNWYFSKVGYVRRDACVSGKRLVIYMHRAIASPAIGQVVDHANGDKLDNRRANLRVVTQRENSMNARRRKDNTSGVKGVYWRKDRQKWQARLVAYGKRITLGCFPSLEEAAAAYAEGNATHHGEYGRTK